MLQKLGDSSDTTDDTSVNNIKFECRGLNNSHTGTKLSLNWEGEKGTYGAWSGDCPLGKAICGLQTRTEEYQGKLGIDLDDTALNDVILFCC